MKNRKKHLSILLALAMAFVLLPAAAFADDALPVPVEESSIVWDSEAGTLTMPGTAGQEYVAIEYNDGELDWSEAVEPDENGSVQFTGIEKNCTYDIFTRIKGAEGAAMTLVYTYESGGSQEPDPAEEEGLQEPKWLSQMPEYPEEGDAKNVAVNFLGNEAQEYTICEKGETPDWGTDDCFWRLNARDRLHDLHPCRRHGKPRRFLRRSDDIVRLRSGVRRLRSGQSSDGHPGAGRRKGLLSVVLADRNAHRGRRI